MRQPHIHSANSLEDAVERLADLGEDGAVIAGGTWVLRAPLRGENFKSCYVSLERIGELRQIHIDGAAEIGALVTHSQLAAIGDGYGPLDGIVEASRSSAFRAVRNVATVGGNICASPFPEADLTTALLAADAKVEVATPAGRETVGLGPYLESRSARASAEVVVSVKVPTSPGRRASYERLTVRSGGEYPIAAVAVSLDLDDGVVEEARIAIGSVEELARRATNAESVLRGRRVDDAVLEEAGVALAAEFKARDGVDAPGWYRSAVLPSLFKEAVTRIVPSRGRR